MNIIDKRNQVPLNNVEGIIKKYGFTYYFQSNNGYTSNLIHIYKAKKLFYVNWPIMVGMIIASRNGMNAIAQWTDKETDEQAKKMFEEIEKLGFPFTPMTLVLK